MLHLNEQNRRKLNKATGFITLILLLLAIPISIFPLIVFIFEIHFYEWDYFLTALPWYLFSVVLFALIYIKTAK